MSGSGTIRRGGARPAQRAKSRQRKPSLLDRLIARLPVSQATLHRIVTWAITLAVLAVVGVVLTLMGIPRAVGHELAEMAGDAGFRVEDVEVSGLDHMDRMTVYAVALDQKSRAMPLVDLDEVRERLMRYGWVADAQVSRRLPDTLTVHIVERVPTAVWQDDGTLTLIDANGVELAPVSPDAMPDLPLVIGPNANLQEPGYQALLAAAPDLKRHVRAAAWVGDRRWDLTFDTGETLRLPEGDEPAARAIGKFAALAQTDHLLGRGWLSFDLRDPTRLVARKPGASSRHALDDMSTGSTGDDTTSAPAAAPGNEG